MSQYRQFLTKIARGKVSWRQRALAFALWVPAQLAACLYGLGAQLKNVLFELGLKRPFKADVPVISVGNLSVGGTGKSPVVRWIARYLLDKHQRVAVLSRGYKQLAAGQNDEALELATLTPEVLQLQNPDRVASAETACAQHATALILDDGFQHRRMGRDLDIVLIDASEPVGLQRVLPRGVLREPFRNIARADAVIFTHWDRAAQELRSEHETRVRKYLPHAPFCKTQHAPSCLRDARNQTQPLERLAGARVLAFCGIGNPTSFFESLSSLGATIAGEKTWPDHHHFQPADLAGLKEQFAAMDCQMLICTMKDLVKIRELAIEELPIYALQVEIEFLAGKAELEEFLDSSMQTTQASSAES